MDPRDLVQRGIANWARDMFGKICMNRHERVRRVLEEAIELAQAEGLPREDVDKLTSHVYAKPKGEPFQELGGLCVTILVYAESRGYSALAAEQTEIERITAISPEVFRARHEAKARAGIAVHGKL